MSRSVHFGRNIYDVEKYTIPLIEGEKLHRIQTTLFSINDIDVVDFIVNYVEQRYDMEDGIEYNFDDFDDYDSDWTIAMLIELLNKKGFKKEADALILFGEETYFEVW